MPRSLDLLPEDSAIVILRLSFFFLFGTFDSLCYLCFFCVPCIQNISKGDMIGLFSHHLLLSTAIGWGSFIDLSHKQLESLRSSSGSQFDKQQNQPNQRFLAGLNNRDCILCYSNVLGPVGSGQCVVFVDPKDNKPMKKEPP